MIKLNTPYLCFTRDTPTTEAERRFIQRYGADPETIEQHKGILWVGPTPNKDTQAHDPIPQTPTPPATNQLHQPRS